MWVALLRSTQREAAKQPWRPEALQPERLGGCLGKPGWRNPDGFEGVRELSGSLMHPGQYILVTKSTEKSAV